MSIECNVILEIEKRELKVVSGFFNSPEENATSDLWAPGAYSQSNLISILSCPDCIFIRVFIINLPSM